jgi:pyruvate/2-oxoglutarate dehydrogenase complex dihydrolipoamide dehydrogenase (E3) component
MIGNIPAGCWLSIQEADAYWQQQFTIYEMGATLEDVAGTIRAHPTLGEAVQESPPRALGHTLHI